MDMQEAAEKVFPGALRSLRPTWELVDVFMLVNGQKRDVKTIYVSYTDGQGNVTAAVHPDLNKNVIEIALTLTPDDDQLLYDAVHLKWRWLPAAVQLKEVTEFTDEIRGLLARSISNAGHVHPRPTEDFIRHSRRKR